VAVSSVSDTGERVRLWPLRRVLETAIWLLIPILLTTFVASGAANCSSSSPDLRCTVVQYFMG
jgi:hypothetical protein